MIVLIKTYAYCTFAGYKIIKADGHDWQYIGEIDDTGLACGYGVATNQNENSYKGTFFNDTFEGIGK